MSLIETVGENNDFPPEYCQYPDVGCEFSPTCLNCHLPVCVYDEPGGKQALLKRRRKEEMTRMFKDGNSIKELAVIFDVSVRTVQRILKSLKKECQAGDK